MKHHESSIEIGAISNKSKLIPLILGPLVYLKPFLMRLVPVQLLCCGWPFGGLPKPFRLLLLPFCL